ncbi:hypothetical protein PQJ75_26120 [Rhodoplanes sp. TEM]|uniref:Zinc-finger domain-containing protein n=1 Tax=Rhodoplanes tepidamans TaxID=200616 RepID=A0ABT5JGX3_RHOTP|nr:MULTISPECIES: hypothetical protein [Rhodoplanes]MDC7788964.1 hypothetical protein [Rhodoplanes tepidamans]MDC7987225.1 hypothetical protein [Rhodoplanes sp. TEM]MDQ0358658.1 anti-sigma factor RsiW [Rhodoplanes tepidamans]
MMTTDRRGLDRAALEEMLPWHAAGTLSRDESEAVEAALARDPELAHRYELVREELAETIHLNESLGAPSARAMDRVLAAIAAEDGPARKPRAGGFLARRLTDFFEALSPRAVAWAGAAAAIVIVAQASVIAGLSLGPQEGGRLEMASYDGAAAEAPATYALIRFQPQASAGDVARVLEARKVSIVDGPKPGGLFRIRLADHVLTEDELGRLLAALQAEKGVVGFVAKSQ